MSMNTLANNKIMPSMKENISFVVKIRAFQDFYIKPRLLINRVQIVFPNLISKFANQFSKWLAKAKIWLAEKKMKQISKEEMCSWTT